MIGSPKPTAYESLMPPAVNLEASVRSRGEEGATARERDLIEAGLSEPAGGGFGLWGLCQRRWVRDGALAETGDAFCGLNAASVSDCGSWIVMGDAVKSLADAAVAPHRIGPMPTNAASLAGVIGQHGASGL